MGIASGHNLSGSIVSALSESRLNARLYSSALGMKWSKLMTNLLVNASSAILDMTPPDILADLSLYAVEIAQLREAIQVIHALKLPVVDLPGTPTRILAWTASHLPLRLSGLLLSGILGRGRGQKMPSFHIDLHSGLGLSEVDFLNGAVVRFGERLGVPTPINRWLNQTMLDLTRGSLPLDEYAHQPEKYLAKLSL
jgi:2-dehydropantoate 2-reductase